MIELNDMTDMTVELTTEQIIKNLRAALEIAKRSAAQAFTDKNLDRYMIYIRGASYIEYLIDMTYLYGPCWAAVDTSSETDERYQYLYDNLYEELYKD